MTVFSLDLIRAEIEIQELINELEAVGDLFDSSIIIQKLETLLEEIKANRGSNVDLTLQFHAAVDEIEELLEEKIYNGGAPKL